MKFIGPEISLPSSTLGQRCYEISFNSEDLKLLLKMDNDELREYLAYLATLFVPTTQLKTQDK